MEFQINFQHVRFIGLDKQPTIHLIALHESQFLFQIVLLNISTPLTLNDKEEDKETE